MKNKFESYIMPTYGDRDLLFSSGKGCYLYTPSGEKYLDNTISTLLESGISE